MDEVESRDLVFVTAQLEQADFSNEIPHNDIGILRTTSQSYTGLVKYEGSDAGLVAIEADNDSRYPRVPDSYTAVSVPTEAISSRVSKYL